MMLRKHFCHLQERFNVVSGSKGMAHSGHSAEASIQYAGVNHSTSFFPLQHHGFFNASDLKGSLSEKYFCHHGKYNEDEFFCGCTCFNFLQMHDEEIVVSLQHQGAKSIIAHYDTSAYHHLLTFFMKICLDEVLMLYHSSIIEGLVWLFSASYHVCQKLIFTELGCCLTFGERCQDPLSTFAFRQKIADNMND